MSSLAGRRVRIGEIITALEIGRSTYYEQRDDGRLASPDNLVRLAEAFRLNPVELMVACGVVSHDAAAGYAASSPEKPTRTRRNGTRLRPRMDLPPL